MSGRRRPTRREVDIVRSSAAEYLTFVAAVGDQEEAIEVRFQDQTIWLTQRLMATLYGVDVRTVNEHLRTIFGTGELAESAVIRKFRITAGDGETYDTQHYSLDAILAVGFKVNNERAVQFRRWATPIVRGYTMKGFAMDDERLKRGGTILTGDYFEELLERIREIRLSERRFYQKVTDIYATALDYDSAAPATQRSFATVQNKLHWAIHGQTAAELIVARADANQEHMGLTSWQDAPEGKVQRFDVVVAKNYLTEPELAQLSRPCPPTCMSPRAWRSAGSR